MSAAIKSDPEDATLITVLAMPTGLYVSALIARDEHKKFDHDKIISGMIELAEQISRQRISPMVLITPLSESGFARLRAILDKRYSEQAKALEIALSVPPAAIAWAHEEDAEISDLH